GEVREHEIPIAGMAGGGAGGPGPLGGRAHGPHKGGPGPAEGFGGGYKLDGGGEAAEDDAGDASAELLEDDGLDQGLEIRGAKSDTIIAYLFDNGGEHRIAGAEVVNGLLHVDTRRETLARRGASTLLYRDANTQTYRAHDGQRTAGAGPDAHHQGRCRCGQYSGQRPG